ncbi:MAG: zinc dependent phospholipase C family protein [Bacillaceae bacterium]|nr:zinc dependent phospholipase C family protein [Bacillaceae bacterium]
MPNIWTHILYGEKLLESLDIKFDNPDERQLFRLGTQGPDFFFYHRFWPWMKDKKGPIVGEMLHKQNCGPFLMEMADYVRHEGCPTQLSSYTIGFLTHHILDRTAHPYIFYKSGLEGNKHQEFEIIIDTLLLEKWRGIKAWKTPVYKQLQIGKSLTDEIVEMFQTLIGKVYPEYQETVDRELIRASYRDMMRALRVLYDPTGLKNKILGGLISSFSYRRNIDRRVDYLNNNRQPWIHPAVKEEVRTDSFEDLLENALEEGKQVLSALIHYWDSSDSDSARARERLEQLIGNVSYDLGQPCEHRLEMKYFDVVI